MAEIVVTISGPVGCGKSAVAGEIEIALKAIGIPVRCSDPSSAQSEKNMTHADWQTYLEMYKPSVVLVDEIDRLTTLPISKIWMWAQVAVCCAAVWILLDVTRYYAGRGTAWIVGLSLFFLAALALFRLAQKNAHITRN